MKAFIITILIGVATALDVVPGSYIIQLKPGTSASAHHRAVRSLLRKLDSTIQSFSIGKDFNAYAATALSTEDAAALSGRDDVLFVEPDFYISEFEGRARFGFSGVTGGTAFEEDGDGHGTHVAGTVAGKTYGVAKKAQVVAVKVFGSDGTGQASWLLAGITWAVNDILARNAVSSSVINLSLSTNGPSTSLEGAVRAAWNQGIVSVSAAGNSDSPAANLSPARIAETITVGMTRADRRRSQIIPNIYGSNWGPELDVFAPGEEILSAGWRSDTDTRTTTGTSMATPLVAGLISYLRALEGGLASPSSVKARLVALGHKGVVTDPKGSPNVLVYNGSGR
ncbi:alkaline proteinase [Pyricularia oryzae]|nr:alkaline proteinase [Pyricularia oryzae]KAI7920574.1 alkaline proteinase [Pyricularia oryzae]